VKCCN